jgi:hypothetical protein
LAYFLANFNAPSFASVPELQKKTLSANDVAVSFLASVAPGSV